MKREVYRRGTPGTKYGIWNTQRKCWQFGICEDTPMLAEARLFQKIGDDARKWRFEPRPLPKEMWKTQGKETRILIADESAAQEQRERGCEWCRGEKCISTEIYGEAEIVKMTPLPAINLTTGEQDKTAEPPYWGIRVMLDGMEDIVPIKACPMCGHKLDGEADG